MSLVYVKSIRMDINDDTKYLSIYNSIQDPYFELDKLCRLIDIKDSSHKVSIIFPENISKQKIQTNGGMQLKNVVNYMGALQVLFSTHTDTAKKLHHTFLTIMNDTRINELEQHKNRLENQNRVLQIEMEEERKQMEEERKNFTHYKIYKSRLIEKTRRNHIKPMDRIIDHYYPNSNLPLYQRLTRDLYRHVMSKHKILCTTCDSYHIMSSEFANILKGITLQISKLLAKEYKIHYNEFPAIHNASRANIYDQEFYQFYGDAVIHDYLVRHPFETWGIRWCRDTQPLNE